MALLKKYIAKRKCCFIYSVGLDFNFRRIGQEVTCFIGNICQNAYYLCKKKVSTVFFI